MPATEGLTFYVSGKVASSETFRPRNSGNPLRSVSILYRTSYGTTMLSGVMRDERAPAGLGEGAEVVAQVTASIRNGRLSAWIDRINVRVPAPEPDPAEDLDDPFGSLEMVSQGPNGAAHANR